MGSVILGYNGLPLPPTPAVPRTGGPVRIAYVGDYGSPSEVCAIEWAHNAALPDVRRVLPLAYDSVKEAFQAVADDSVVAAVVVTRTLNSNNKTYFDIDTEIWRQLSEQPVQIVEEMTLADDLFLAGPPGSVLPPSGPIDVLVTEELESSLAQLPLLLRDRVAPVRVSSYADAARRVLCSVHDAEDPPLLALLNMRSLSFFKLTSVLGISKKLQYKAFVVRRERWPLHEPSVPKWLAVAFSDEEEAALLDDALAPLTTSRNAQDFIDDDRMACLEDTIVVPAGENRKPLHVTVLSGTFPVLKSLGVVEGKDVASAMFPLTSRQANSWSFYSSISTVINEDDARARSIDPVLLQNPCDIIGKLPAEVALVILHHLARSSPRHLARAMRVSRTWCTICREPSLWEDISQRLLPSPSSLFPDGVVEYKEVVHLQVMLKRTWASLLRTYSNSGGSRSRSNSGSGSVGRTPTGNEGGTVNVATPVFGRNMEICNQFYYVTPMAGGNVLVKMLRRKRLDEIVLPGRHAFVVAISQRLIAVQVPDGRINIYDLYASREPRRVLNINMELYTMSLSQSVLVGLHLSAVVAIDIHTGRDLLQLNELYLSNHDLENKLLALLLFDRLIVYDLSVSPPALYHCSIGEGARNVRLLQGIVYLSLRRGVVLKFDIFSGAYSFMLQIPVIKSLFLLYGDQLVVFANPGEPTMTVVDIACGRPLGPPEVRCAIPLYLDETVAIYPGGIVVEILANAKKQLRWVQESMRKSVGN